MSDIFGDANDASSVGTAFGHGRADVGNFGHEIRGEAVEWPSSLFALLPEAVSEDAAAWTETLLGGPAGLYPSLSSDASRLILTATVNDAVSLISHVDHLDGRSAAHCARALFEHLINAQDVEATPANEQRYMDHRAVTQERVSQRRWYLPLLDPVARRKETARLDKLGRGMERTVRRLVASYGSGFRRSWAEQNLKDRADKHGFGADYDGYRILSSVIHGSSGSMAGVVREINGARVHRTGPDLDLAATAYVEGMRSAYQYFDRMFIATARPEAAALRDGAERLLAHTGHVRDGLARIDRMLWPAYPSPPPAALLAFYRGGRERWFVYYPQTQTVMRADKPNTDASLLDEVRRRAREAGWVNPDGRPITVIVPGVAVTPRIGAQAVPAGSIMVPPELRR
ncbi:DUF5677 domain-containing protein [Microbacterium sp. NPDC089987]|uniref:DUF5677 domain-containing protein n=1 Tax=Microbacterium sp. NPDC089987 TaxID=3364202 RepID=UPI003824C8B7